MKREFLESLGLESEVIDKIMKENGKDIESAKAKFSDYDDIRAQLKTANETLEKFKDYDQTKAEVEKYKSEAEKIKQESAAKITAMERSGKVKDYLSGKKFVNKITQDAITAKMCEVLGADESKGKNFDDIFAEITKDETNILENNTTPTPPSVTKMGGGKTSKDEADEDARIDAIMGLTAKAKE
ncbi:phage scaffolding protein [Treponema pectinovorum]|uniref:phage scaffolding protein n=1 Tax=Treponema pectinovorum TaxID=164 RepID=UPI0011CB1FAC|nr:phage scaffolding protein [Treponema pectinovorum]